MRHAPVEIMTSFAKNGVNLWGPAFEDPENVVQAHRYWREQGAPQDVDIYWRSGAVRLAAKNPPPPDFRTGDRIVCTSMTEDPAPLLYGSRGTVRNIQFFQAVPACWLVDVAWDSGRTLSLVMPFDTAVLESVV